MPAYEFVTVDVFTERRFGGNPLAVFPQADGLGDADMRDIAREFNLSETTFVLAPQNPAHTARVRIFTPAGEIPFAGHPNIGTGYVLACRGNEADELIFEELAGLVRLRPDRGAEGQPTGAMLTAPQTLSIGDDIPAELVAACAGLETADIWQDTHKPVVAGVGIASIIAELASAEALSRAAPQFAAFRELVAQFPDLAAHAALHLYVRDESDVTRISTRMFAPLIGVPEDPATGSANAALAALLTSFAPGEDVELAFDISQGVEMGRPSRLLATARKTAEGEISASIAGSCVPVTRGWLDL